MTIKKPIYKTVIFVYNTELKNKKENKMKVVEKYAGI